MEWLRGCAFQTRAVNDRRTYAAVRGRRQNHVLFRDEMLLACV